MTEDNGKSRPLNSLNLFLLIGFVVILVAGGLFFFAQTTSNPGCAGKGPCMLYFYADD